MAKKILYSSKLRKQTVGRSVFLINGLKDDLHPPGVSVVEMAYKAFDMRKL